MASLTNLVVLIPAYRPQPILLSLIQELKRVGLRNLVVVDDGSGSSYADTFAKISAEDGVVVLEHARNLGKGAALKTGINRILVAQKNCEGIITADADGQHQVRDILRLAEAFLLQKSALFLGARRFRGEVPLRSRFGNECTKLVFRALIGRALHDTQTGLRAIPNDFAGELLTIRSNRYEFELDMLIKAVESNVPIRELEIATIYEEGNPTSHFNPLLDSLRIYFVFFRFVLASLCVFLADLFVFTLAFWTSKALFFSVTLGRFAGLIVSLLASKGFVFRSEQSIRRVIPRFFLLWLGLLGISYGLTLLLTSYGGLNTYLARILVDTGLFLFNFSVQRNFIFASKFDSAGSDAESETGAV